MVLSFVFFVFLILGCASHHSRTESKPYSEETSEVKVSRYIDVHLHLPTYGADGFRDLAQTLEKHGVIGGVIHENRKHFINTFFIEDKPPKRFLVCAAVVPGRDVRKIAEEIDRGNYHCLKIYLGYVYKYANDRFYLPFYELARKKRVPVIFHTGDTYDKKGMLKYTDPITIDEIAIQYPDVKFVIAHVGNPWFVTASEVAYKNDNVYLDLSGLILGDSQKLSDEAIQELVVQPLRWSFHYVENPKKFLFGSDWPLVALDSYVSLIQKAIPAKYWRDIFFHNALEVFPELKKLINIHREVPVTESAN